MMPDLPKNERLWAILSYLPLFNVVPCLVASVRMVESKFVLFHARQGLVLFALWFVSVLIAIISPVISLILWVVMLILHGFGMAIAWSKQTMQIPLVGQIAMKIPETYLFSLLTGKIPNNKS